MVHRARTFAYPQAPVSFAVNPQLAVVVLVASAMLARTVHDVAAYKQQMDELAAVRVMLCLLARDSHGCVAVDCCSTLTTQMHVCVGVRAMRCNCAAEQ